MRARVQIHADAEAVLFLLTPDKDVDRSSRGRRSQLDGTRHSLEEAGVRMFQKAHSTFSTPGTNCSGLQIEIGFYQHLHP
jgi:hypothetical protein